MLSALNQYYKWPVMRVIFTLHGEMVALFNVAKTGKELHSLPHCDSLGLMFIGDLQEQTIVQTKVAELIEHAGLYYDMASGVTERIIELTDNDLLTSITSTQKVKTLGIRCFTPVLKYSTPLKVVTMLPLKGRLSDVLSGLPSNVRRKINKAAKNNVRVKSGGLELLNDYYRLYRQAIKRHGSFALPEKYIAELIKDQNVRLFTAYLNGDAVGSAMLIKQGNFAENNAFATSVSHNKYYVSYALHAEMISYSISMNCTTYSFGRSTPGSGVHIYKQQFGGVDKILYYNSLAPQAESLKLLKLVPPLVKLMPTWIASGLDHFISTRIY